jgi:hypothetical protein
MSDASASDQPLSEPESVFINMPYADDYEERLLALIAGLTLHGLVPTAAMVAGDDPNRLERILEAIGDCRLSLHDLTWMSLDGKDPHTPRFNMPFELGIAVALARVVDNEYVILDTVPNRLDKALSDVRGMDAQIFDGSAMGVFRALSNIFHRNDFQPEPRHFRRVMSRLKSAAARIKRDFGFKSVFEAKPFSDLRRLAGLLVADIHHSAAPTAAPTVAPPGGRAVKGRLTPHRS